MIITPESIKNTSFQYLYNHLFLPRKLSSADDETPKNEGLLLDFVLQSLQHFLPERHDAKAISASISMLQFFRKSRNNQGHLRDAGVREALQGLTTQGMNFHLLLRYSTKLTKILIAPIAVFQITEQNAGVIISRYVDTVCFEMFELSPTNEAVMTTRGRLTRCFPTTAVEVALSDFECDAFQTVISKTLAKMSQQPLRETKQKQTRSQEKEHQNTVDTAHPMIITELFTSMLRGCGKAVSSRGIRKNTRDEIIRKDHKDPWRRSPLWLLIRVALQLAMTRCSREEDATYKEFMVFLMTQTLHVANQQQKTSSDILSNMSTKVSRRLSKLRSPSSGAWLSNVRSIVSKTLDTLNQRWTQIQDRAEPSLDIHDLCEINMVESTLLPLKEMDDFLSSMSR